MEIYKWKWMMLGALGCMNIAYFERTLNDNIVLGNSKMSTFEELFTNFT